MPSASNNKTKRYSTRKINKAIQLNLNFWLGLDDLTFTVSSFSTKKQQAVAFAQYLHKYAVDDLIFEEVGIETFTGIKNISKAFADQYHTGTGFAGEHSVFTYPIVRKEGTLLALYANDITLINHGDTNNGAINISRIGVYFNEDLKIVKIKLALRATQIGYPYPFTGWNAINFPLPPFPGDK